MKEIISSSSINIKFGIKEDYKQRLDKEKQGIYFNIK